MNISAYFLIEFSIRDKILSGQLQSGSQLPTERELCEEFGVSVMTVRTALSKLENDNLIFRKAGKGTFVREGVSVSKPMMIRLETVGGTLRYSFEKPSGYSVKVIEVGEKEIGETGSAANLTRFLGKSDKERIGIVRRVRLVNDIPVQYIVNFIPVDMMKYVTTEELSQRTLQNLLKEKGGLSIGSNEIDVESIPADPEIAEVLGCSVFIPLILLRSYFWFGDGRPYSITNLFGNPLYVKYRIVSGAAEFGL